MAGSRESIGEEAWQVFTGVHRMLLRLAGQVPDDLLTHLRSLVGSGDLPYLPDTVVGSAAQLGVALTQDELELMRTVLDLYVPDERDPVGTDGLSISPVTARTGHRFAPASAEVLRVAGPRIPARLDLTGGDPEDLADLPEDLADLADLADDLAELTDELAIISLSRQPGVIGLWRAWRFGPDGPLVDGRRVFLVEVERDVPAWDVGYHMQDALADTNEEFPQVEVYWTGDALPPYQRAARAGSALLWAREVARVQPAPVYDRTDGAGRPVFDPGHPRVPDGAERDWLLNLLRGGVALGDDGEPTLDVVTPARGRVVPSGHRTDGRWVWSEAIAYYLEEYGLAPHPELARQLSAAAAEVDGVALFRAETALLR